MPDFHMQLQDSSLLCFITSSTARMLILLERIDFLTYQHLPLHISVFPLTLLQSYSAKILEKVKCCMCK